MSARLRKSLIAGFALLLVYLAYLPGIGGALFYDDYGNLEGLASVTDWDSARRFVTGGIAGPLGRPLALLTFLPHASGWPENAAAILQVNILIHVLNTGLLFALGYLLLGLRRELAGREQARFWAALGAALLWAGMPLIASTTLIAIQRMTSLSTCLGLLGLIAFTLGYRVHARRPWLGLFAQGIGLGLGTALAMLSKENGALIPVFALLIDGLIVEPERRGERVTATLRRLSLVVALVTLLVYISPLARDWGVVSEARGYSSWQRVQTEMVVLWEYLRAAFLPRPSLYGPFHDDRGIAFLGLPSFVAAVTLAMVLAGTLWAALSRRWIWPAFAVCWFLVAHMLESSSILLEIYFEHRNYLALYGFCLALTVAVSALPSLYRRLGIVLFSAYTALQYGVLLMLTVFWGNADQAAQVWAQEHPASARAAINATVRYMSSSSIEVADANQKIIRRQQYELAREVVQRTVNHCPECMDMRLQLVIYGCLLKNPGEQQYQLEQALQNVRGAKGTRAVVDSLFSLRELINKDECSGVDRDKLVALIHQLAESQLFTISHIKARLLFVAAAFEEDQGHTEARDNYLAQAEEVSPMAVPVLQYQFYSALREGRLDDAETAVKRRYPQLRLHAREMTPELLDSLLDELANERENAKAIRQQ